MCVIAKGVGCHRLPHATGASASRRTLFTLLGLITAPSVGSWTCAWARWDEVHVNGTYAMRCERCIIIWDIRAHMCCCSICERPLRNPRLSRRQPNTSAMSVSDTPQQGGVERGGKNRCGSLEGAPDLAHRGRCDPGRMGRGHAKSSRHCGKSV